MENDVQKRIEELAKIMGSSEEDMMAEVVKQHMSELMMTEGFAIASAQRKLARFAEWLLEENPPHNVLLEAVVAFTAQCITSAHQMAYAVFRSRFPEVRADFDTVREVLLQEHSTERELAAHAIRESGMSSEQFRRYTTHNAFKTWLGRNSNE